MNPKIPKLREELNKNKAKISELQARGRDLERQLRELENTDIVGLVRESGMTLEDFAALLRRLNAPATETKEASAHEKA